jgi:cytochrome c oxidase subunit 4
MTETRPTTAAQGAGHKATHAHEPLSYRFLTLVWAGLMCCTAATIAVARIDLGYWNVIAALGVASLKASLVIFFFMHLKYENWVIKGMVLTAFVILAIAIGFTFVDVGYRY